MGLLAVLVAGFLLGFRHAFEPDHLAAVSTLATRQGTVREAARLGLAWGLGHTASVAMAAFLVIATGIELPATLQPMAELVVAALLFGLGTAVLVGEARRHRGEFGEAHRRAHRQRAPHYHAPPIRDARRSLGFGLAHGLAGSSAVIALLVAGAATRTMQIAYIAAFGSGTVIGMLAVSAALVAAVRTAGGVCAWPGRLHLAAAAASITIGIALGIRSAGSF